MPLERRDLPPAVWLVLGYMARRREAEQAARYAAAGMMRGMIGG